MTMRQLTFVLSIAAAACSDSQVPPQASLPSVTLPAELERVLRDYETAYAGRDTSALARLFSDDGYLLQPRQPPVRGGANVARVLSQEGGPLALVPIAFALGDSVGYVIGTFGAEQSAGQGGKFVLALKRRGTEPWRIAADIANPNR